MKLILPIILFTLCISEFKAQSIKSTYKNTSLDVITNPASIVMGESFVANAKNTSSFLENPANLSSTNELGLFYNNRSDGWMELTKNYNYNSTGFSINTNIGTIGFVIKQFSTGISTYDVFSGLTYKEVNRTYQLSFAKIILPNFKIGLSCKVFNHTKNDEQFNNSIESNNAFLFDFGIHYSKEIGKIKNSIHQISFGAVLQNLGTDYKEKYSLFSDKFFLVRLPRYFVIGFSYNLQLKNSSGNNDIEALITGQYKNLINPLNDEKFDVDYWGGGAEILIKNIFAARIGFIQLPEHKVYFERAKPLLRYGFGIVLPLEKIGINIPLVFGIDYAFIPIDSTTTSFDGVASNNMLNAIGFTFRYKNIFF